MNVFGLPQRKYIYPTIMLVGLFILLMRYAMGGDATPPPVGPDSLKDGMESTEDVFQHSENDFINASEGFNDSIHSANHGNLMETRHQRLNEAMRDASNTWDVRSDGYYIGDRRQEPMRFDRYSDSRYNQERRRLDDMRTRELSDYRERRHDIQTRMSRYNRNSYDYERLERDLNELDRRHAEEERKFERDFRNMDANYSINRW